MWTTDKLNDEVRSERSIFIATAKVSFRQVPHFQYSEISTVLVASQYYKHLVRDQRDAIGAVLPVLSRESHVSGNFWTSGKTVKDTSLAICSF